MTVKNLNTNTFPLARAALLTGALIVSACAAIQKYETLAQPLGQALVAGQGDIVLHIDRSRDLENVAGKADLYGRKTNEGYTEVRYLGAEPGGVLVFARKDVVIRSNETTMTRAGGMFIPNTTTTTHSGMVGGASYSGTSTTTGGGTFVPAPKANVVVLPADTIAIRVDPTQPAFRVGNFLVRVVSVHATGLQFQVDQAR